jgi:hypothetical protein
MSSHFSFSCIENVCYVMFDIEVFILTYELFTYFVCTVVAEGIQKCERICSAGSGTVQNGNRIVIRDAEPNCYGTSSCSSGTRFGHAGRVQKQQG